MTPTTSVPPYQRDFSVEVATIVVGGANVAAPKFGITGFALAVTFTS